MPDDPTTIAPSTTAARRPKLDDMERTIMVYVGSLRARQSYCRSVGSDLHPEQAQHLAALEETLSLFDKLRACRAEVAQVFRRAGLEGGQKK